MSINKKYTSIVVKGVGSKTHPKGALTGVLYIDGKYKSSKEASLVTYHNDFDGCFEIIDEWCKNVAKEYGATYRRRDKDTVLRRFDKIKGKHEEDMKEQTKNPLLLYTNSTSTWKSNILAMVIAHGFDRTKELLSYGLDLVNEIELKEIELGKATLLADQSLAQSMVDIEIKTGVSMKDNISNKAVLALFIKLLTKAKEQ